MTPNRGDSRPTRSAKQFTDRTLKYPPGELLASLYRWRGPVTRSGRYAYLLGPDANQFIFKNAELFSWREAFKGRIPVDGETALIVSDGAAHRHMRRLIQPSFHHRQVEHYLRTIADSADAAIDEWRTGQRVDVYQALRAPLRRTTIELLFGQRMAADTAFFTEQLQEPLHMFEGMPQVAAWKQRLSTPQARRVVADLRRIDERISAEVCRIRRDPGDCADNLLSHLVHSADESGQPLSHREIRDQVVNLINAAETAHPVMAWAIYGMLSTPGAWDRAADEVRRVLGDRSPTAEDLKRLTYLNGVVQETLRLYPPSAISVRYVVRDFEFAAKRIKRGTTVLFSPYVTHRLPELWPAPLAFRPQRWDPAELDYRKRRNDHFLPFTAGLHRCIGAELATAQLTVMLARLLSRHSLRLPAQTIRPTILPMLRPADGLQVEIVT